MTSRQEAEIARLALACALSNTRAGLLDAIGYVEDGRIHEAKSTLAKMLRAVDAARAHLAKEEEAKR